MSHRRLLCFSLCGLVLFGLLCLTTRSAIAQTTAFTYQGKLTDSGNLANAAYDMQFKLFDALTNGTQIGATLTFDGTGSNPPAVSVTNGIFAVTIDFGACPTCFNSAARFLEIAVRVHGVGSYITLIPRQPITATPYAMKTANLTFNGAYNDGTTIFTATNSFAGDSAGLNTTPNPSPISSSGKFNSFYGVGAGQANTTGNFNALFGALAGNANTTGNFNSFFGMGAGESNTTGSSNAFFGAFAGELNTTGTHNTFFGNFAGSLNTTGADNAFFGNLAGKENSTGSSNAFFGNLAGELNSTGVNNAFFGAEAGRVSTTGSENAFFGSNAGRSNTIGFQNSFFGDRAGRLNSTGFQNAFFGTLAGSLTTNGTQNTFLGIQAGKENTSGSFNTFIGYLSDFSTANPTGNRNTLLGYFTHVDSAVSNGTAIGDHATVTQSNSLILGSINGVNSAIADTFVGIGTTAPSQLLHINSATSNAATLVQTPTNSFAQYQLASGAAGTWIIGTQENFAASALLFRNASSDRMVIQPGGNVGIGTTSPSDKLHVAGDVRVGTGTNGCVKDANGTIIAGTCSSDARLKHSIVPFAHLLDRVVQLQPVHFYWRAEEFKDRHFGNKSSFGLIAQEVEKVLPELVSEDEQGYKAVNYSKLPLLSLQAIKELKSENYTLKQKLSEQQQQLTQQQEMAAIKQLLCQSQPQADLCKVKTPK